MENVILKRKVYEKLLDWKKNSNGRTAILIEGARRVGKSTIAEEFAKNEYQSYIIIDFNIVSTEIKDLFIHEREDLDFIFNKLQTYYDTVLETRKSLIIFDEVQFCPEARSLIKYLVKDGRYDYIETGSLISLKENTKDILIPSEESKIKMYPLDFEEFLWALDHTMTIPFLKKCFDEHKPVEALIHRKMMKEFRTYILVGGMPQAVIEYIKTKDFGKVDLIKKEILNLYHDDIYKYGKEDSKKILAIYDNIPGELSKGSKKFMLSSVSSNARSRDYEDALIWLDEAKMINLCYNVTDPNIGLALSAEDTFYKCYQFDTGLLVTQTFANKPYLDNELYKAILFDKLNVNEGMLMENFVANTLKSKGYDLYFYSKKDNEKAQNTMEVDFIIIQDKKLNPIEVKSGKYNKHTSIDRFKKKYKKNVGTRYVLHPQDLKVEDDIIYLPLYMAIFL